MKIFEDDIDHKYYIKDSNGNKIWFSQDIIDRVVRDKGYEIYYFLYGEVLIMNGAKIVKINKRLIDEIMVESL